MPRDALRIPADFKAIHLGISVGFLLEIQQYPTHLPEAQMTRLGLTWKVAGRGGLVNN